MKTLIILLSLLCVNSFAQITYHGPTGYNFIPNGYTAPQSSFGFLVGNRYTTLNKMNLIFNYISAYTVIDVYERPLEISISNTKGFVFEKGFQNQRYSLPFIPAIKYSWLKSGDKNIWSASSGFTYNYGVYTVATFQTTLPFIIPEATIGLSYALNKAYIMGGAKVTFADSHGAPIPITFIFEGASGGSTKFLGEVDEAFLSTGFSSQITDNITFAGNYRIDPADYYTINEDDPEDRTIKPQQNDTGLFTFSLIFTHKNF